MSLPQQNTLSVTDAAKALGVNRRTVQRWVRDGKVTQFASGRVDYRMAVEHMARHRVGRRAKGVMWKWPGFWSLNETPAMAEAQPFMEPKKLTAFKQMLAVVAHWHTHQNTIDDFIAAVNEVVEVAEKMRELSKHGDVAWSVQVSRFNRRIEEQMMDDLMKEVLAKL